MEPSGIYDNRKRGTVGDYLRDHITPKADLSVVSAYFMIYAYHGLRESLDGISNLRFLFGEPGFLLDPKRTDKKAYNIEDCELRLSNRLKQKAIACDCAEWLREKAEVRSMIWPDFLHGKMYHILHKNGNEDALFGSSNFTAGGLGLKKKGNFELISWLVIKEQKL